ncbi:MAG: iron-containing alcohol dehydrogenase [Synergistaceae bacterium]|nr:iron-containing alcohol dehydrogenase [Synergistaceae bacterium]
MKPYRYPQVRNIYFGDGVVKTTGTIVATEGVKKVLVVTDKFLFDSGILNGALKSLEEAGIEYRVYSDVHPNPLLSNVLACYEIMKELGGEGVIGFGGGSSIDCAKSTALLMTNPLPLHQYVGKDIVPNNTVPIFTIPTTAGTGSEVTSGSIILFDDTGKKGGILSKRLIATCAIVDPELLLTLPPSLTAATGMDALSHAIEAFTNINASLQSDMWCKQAISLIGKNLRRAFFKGDDIDARRGMSLAATSAGMALLGSGCAGSHAMAYSIENKYHTMHGKANASMLPAVMRFNAPAALEKYATVAELLGENISGLSMHEAAYKASEAVQKLCDDLSIPRISAYGVTEEDLEPFAQECCNNARLMAQNPRKITPEDAVKIYKDVF